MAKENATESGKLGIVAKIMKILKLDEEGKVGKFFAKEVKKCETAIRDLKNNRAAYVNIHTSTLEKLNDRLEDAKEQVESAYQAVTIEDIPNNEAMESFSSRYWANVTKAENRLASIEEEIKAAKEANEKQLKEEDAQIAKYEARIARINAA